MGLIPNDQSGFVNGIRQVITNHKQVQQHRAVSGDGSCSVWVLQKCVSKLSSFVSGVKLHCYRRFFKPNIYIAANLFKANRPGAC